MYRITYTHRGSGSESVIYAPGSANHSLVSGVLRIGCGISGSLTMEIPYDNDARNDIVCLTDEIIFYRNNIELWRGRAITAQSDFNLTGTIECEGILRYFYDTYYPPYEHNGPPNDLFRSVVQNHNANSEPEKRFTVGVITVTDPNNVIVRSCQDFTRSLDVLSEKFQGSSLGGYLRTRVQNGTKYIDYIATYGTESSQKAEYGYNILDIAESVDYGTVATAMIPLGAIAEDGNGDKDRVNIASLNNGSIYIFDADAVARYGWICAPVDETTWDDVTDASNLLTKARALLPKYTSAIRRLTVRAVDMNLVDGSIRSWQLGDEIHIKSEPHGIDTTVMLTELEIDVVNIENNTLTFGSESTLTDQLNRSDRTIVDRLATETERRVNAYEDLQKALNESGGFYVTPVVQPDGGSIYYMHDKPTLAESTFVVKATAEAIGFSTDGGNSYPFGFTITGEMVMDAIQTNHIDAQYINVGNETLTQKFGNVDDTLTQMQVDNALFRVAVSSVQQTANSAVRNVTAYYAVTSTDTPPDHSSGGGQGYRPPFIVGQAVIGTSILGDGVGSAGGVWSTTQPDAVDGAYVWQSFLVEYLDGTAEWTEPTLLTDDFARSKITTLSSEMAVMKGEIVSKVSRQEYNKLTGEVTDVSTKIDQLPDRITLSATGSIGGVAQIKLAVGEKEQTQTIDMSGVRQAFADDNTSVTISAGTVKFEGRSLIINSGNLTLDAAGNATIAGRVNATSGYIGGESGWTITSGKIYGGDATTGVAVMQKPGGVDGTATNVFAAGGTSHSNYNTCPFRVTKEGKLYATDAVITGDVTATAFRLQSDGRTLNFALTSGDYVSSSSGTISYGTTFALSNASMLLDQGRYLMVNVPYNFSGMSMDLPVQLIGLTNTGNVSIGSAEYVYADLTNGAVSGKTMIHGNEVHLIFGEGLGDNASTNANADYHIVADSGPYPRFRPNKDKGCNLGNSNYAWNDAYFASPHTTSDRKEKEHISYLCDVDSVEDFFLGLNPAMYYLKSGTGRRPRIGFYAQEVRDTAVGTVGDLSLFAAAEVLPDGDTAYFNPETPDERLSWSIDYTQFAGIITTMVQKHHAEIEAMRAEISAMRCALNGGIN